MKDEQEGTGSAAEHPIFGPVIFAYTRAEAIEDGVLVDVSTLAKGVGFAAPVAMTRTALAAIAGEAEGYDAGGVGAVKVLEALTAAKIALIRGIAEEKERVPFEAADETYIVTGHPGDNGEPVVTVMLPNED